jgi:hypothetical protein
MKTIIGTIFFIIVLAVSTAQSDVVVADIGTNQTGPLAWTPAPKYLPSDLRHFLESADEFTLYSLNPGPEEHPGTNTFYFHKILGQIKIEKTAERTKLVTALSDGIAGGCAMADCFNPRHGIRAVKNGVAVDFLICFQCGAIEVFSSKGTNWSFPVCRTPADVFNGVLKKAGVSLPSD